MDSNVVVESDVCPIGTRTRPCIARCRCGHMPKYCPAMLMRHYVAEQQGMLVVEVDV